MREAVAAGHGAVRPGRGALGAQELSVARQRGTLRVEVFWRGAHPGGHGRRGKLHPGDAGRRHDRLLRRRQALELLLNQVPQRLGHVHRHVVERRGQLPAVRAVLDDTALLQIGHHRDQEQGMALGALVQHRGELADQRPLAESAGHIQRHLGRGRGADRQCGPLVPHQQLLGQGMDRVGRVPRFGRAIGGQHQEPCGIAAPGHVRQPLQGGGVTPVQVFQHQQQRLLRGQALQRLGQLP